MKNNGFLALAPQYTTTRELLSASARRRGMDVEVLAAGAAGALRGRRGGHYYGGPAYAARVVDDLGIALLEPADAWLATLPRAFTRRRVTTTTLAEARHLTGPAFIKPPSDKSFPAAVYADGGRLPSGPDLGPDTQVLVSSVVTWATEFRLFLLDGQVHTGAQYATFGRLDAAPLEGHRLHDAVREFADDLLTTCGHTLPSAVVVDIGLLTAPAPGTAAPWAVVEANMAWFSNCYAADPNRVLDVVLRSSGPRARATGRDLAFCRDTGRTPGGS
ncbi:ATP-grasp domain-containing protein [Streptomyces sp. NPDC006632]|uniref:ATP-grasp domain-containing protein n=1 Tax=Streptomyces sp. NPDC006632 TaxID=3157182 RepID=UPI0033AAEFB0